MSYVIGIDQGSSHTRAALADLEGHILARSRTDGACHSITGMESAMNAVRDACQDLLDQSGVARGDIRMLAAGMTGADWPDEFALLHQHLTGLGIADEVVVHNDALVAMRGGTRHPYGAILVAGTGANCIVRAPSGQTIHYHYYVEPELQGGTGLGRRVLKAVYRAASGRDTATRLTQAVLAHYGLSQVDDLLRADVEGRLPQGEVKTLAPLLFQIASEGDALALAIVEDFSAGLAELVTSGLTTLDMAGSVVEVVVSGSIFRAPDHLLKDRVTVHIQKVAPEATVINARYEPVVGAVLVALEALGHTIGPAEMAHIEQTSQQLSLIRNSAHEMAS